RYGLFRPQHPRHRHRGIGLPLVGEALLSQPCCDLAQAEPRALCSQRLRRGHQLRGPLGIALAAAALDALGDLAITCRLELRNQRRLLELAMAPSTWRTRTAVGVSSRKWSGADTVTNAMPMPLRKSWPASCTARSRANRSGDSTRMVRTPLPAIRFIMAAKP